MCKLLITLLLATGAVVAQAVPVRYDFTITGFDPQSGFPTDPVADGSGFVAFDPDAFVPVGGAGRVQDSINGLPTLDLSVDWLGQHYDLTSGSLWMLEFFGGQPTRWGIGGRANTCGVPISTFSCLSASGSDFEVIGMNNSGVVIMTVEGLSGSAWGTIAWQQVPYQSVPEPATFGLLVVGILGASLLRRRRRAA